MLQKKPADKITVTDIVSAANINRGTFYAHYSNINELVLSIENEFSSKLCSALEKLDVFNQELSVHEVIAELTGYLEENKKLCKELLILGNANSFTLELQKVFTKYMEHKTQKLMKAFDVPRNSRSGRAFFQPELRAPMRHI